MIPSYQTRAAQHSARRDVELGRSAHISRGAPGDVSPGALPAGLDAVRAERTRCGSQPRARCSPSSAAWSYGMRGSRNVRHGTRRSASRVSTRQRASIADGTIFPEPRRRPAPISRIIRTRSISTCSGARHSSSGWDPRRRRAAESACRSGSCSGAEPAQIRLRQSAVDELAVNDDWREQLAAHGVLARGARQRDLDAFVSWAEGPAAFGTHARVIKAATFTILGSMWLLMAFDWAAGLWLVPLVAGVTLSFAMARRIHAALDRAGAGQQAIGRYAAMFAHVAGAPFHAGPSAGRARAADGRRQICA